LLTGDTLRTLPEVEICNICLSSLPEANNKRFLRTKLQYCNKEVVMYIQHFRAFFWLGTIIFSLLLAAGCKEESSTAPQQGTNPTIVSFTATPSSVPAGGDSVKLSWNVKDATSLSISPGVGSVMPVDSGSVTVFVTASTTFTLTATNSTGSVTATAQVSASLTITVNGYVKDIDGMPISGITVVLKGKTPTTTGGDGSFEFQNVTTPYEIRIILSTQKTAIIYQGLTTTSPSLLYIGSTTVTKQAEISGTVPISTETTLVFYISGTKSWWTTANPATGAYTIDVSWRGSETSFSGNLQVLRWTKNPSGLPLQYDAYGTKQLTVSEGGTFSGNNFIEADFTDPAEQNITGSITTPTTSYSITNKQLSINFGNAYVIIFSESGAALTDNFSYTVPSIGGATFEVDAQASVSAVPNSRVSYYQKKGIAGGSSGVDIPLASAPQLSLPVHNGTDIDTTTQFLWTQGGGTGVNYVEIFPNNPGTPLYYIITAANNTFIPNLSPQGLGLPSNTTYSWAVLRFFPVSTIDDAASDSFITLINGHAGENGRAVSETFSFVTKM
jgi:hypothetical protein